MKITSRKTAGLAVLASLWLAGCGGSSNPVPEEARPQDTRTFTAPVFSAAADFEAGASGTPSFKAQTGSAVATDRWTGVLNGAAYRIEVPKTGWNGKLVMYAHGYVGTTPGLVITTPPIRRYLIDNGYAWAASSYSKNYYDVRAGVEDTNALALSFTKIAGEKGRELAAPTKTYIIGHSMGGHITAAAIEDEAFNNAANKIRYNGAVPMCGVTGDTDLFDYFAGYQLAAQALAGQAAYPSAKFADIATAVRTSLFTTFSTVPTAQGLKLREVVKNLTGGERPVFTEGFANTGLQSVVWGTFGSDGLVNGILTKNTLDTNRFVYQLDNDPALTAEEVALNASIQKLTAAPDANRLRTDGLRWVPKVNGEFKIPVVTIHTLGDMYVPFSMEQIYRARANAKGNGNWLVQRAIRAPSHCDFTVAEQVDAFSAMVTWEQTGVKPAGDDVTTAATVASPTYGCTFTKNAGGADDSPTTVGTRTAIAPGLTPCP
jgi:pimeloyl-ACP methyl ester carboxylesterase